MMAPQPTQTGVSQSLEFGASPAPHTQEVTGQRWLMAGRRKLIQPEIIMMKDHKKATDFSDYVISCTLSQHRDSAREVIINNPDIGDPNI